VPASQGGLSIEQMVRGGSFVDFSSHRCDRAVCGSMCRDVVWYTHPSQSSKTIEISMCERT